MKSNSIKDSFEVLKRYFYWYNILEIWWPLKWENDSWTSWYARSRNILDICNFNCSYLSNWETKSNFVNNPFELTKNHFKWDILQLIKWFVEVMELAWILLKIFSMFFIHHCASNPHSYGVVTFSDTTDLDQLTKRWSRNLLWYH